MIQDSIQESPEERCQRFSGIAERVMYPKEVAIFML
jgi:hypothetical protein